jgi:Tfp pilus assembly pilus retraction ATPase PilT
MNIAQLMTFPSEEYGDYKAYLDRGEQCGTTRVHHEYGRYRVGEIYRTDPAIGHLVRVTQIDELHDIIEHPWFAHMTTAQIAEIREYQQNGLQHVHFESAEKM